MSEQEIQMFKEFFSKYCFKEIDKGNCNEDLCELCPVGKAYEEIFDRFTDDEDGLDEDE